MNSLGSGGDEAKERRVMEGKTQRGCWKRGRPRIASTVGSLAVPVLEFSISHETLGYYLWCGN